MQAETRTSYGLEAPERAETRAGARVGVRRRRIHWIRILALVFNLAAWALIAIAARWAFAHLR